MSKSFRRLGAVLAALVATAALTTGCGQDPLKKSETAEQNSRGEQGETQSAQKSESKPEPGTGDAAKPAAPRQDEIATGDGDDGLTRGMDQPKSAAPPPPTATPPAPAPTTPPPAPPRAEAPGAGAGAGKPEAVGEAPPPAASEEGKSASGGATAPFAPPADKTYDVVPVFYGTDRAVEANPTRLAFGSERGRALQLGRALVTVPMSHKVPEVERPWVVELPYFKVKIYEEAEDPAKHFTLQEISALTKDQMLAFVKERLAMSKNFKDHAIVFVHGFNTPFDFALYRTAQIAYDLKFDSVPFVYSWPSGGKVASYTYDRGSAEQAEPYLAEFLELVVKESGAKSISLIAHSMGNELLLRVLERMRPKAPDGVVISQIILAAPDVDRDKFQNIARQITDFAQGVTLYAASNDRALGYSARFWGGVPRAGDVPATGPLIVPGVDTIDVTEVSTDSLGLHHSGYAENNALLNDIKLLIQTGERPPDKRIPILERKTTQAGAAYWRYPPVR